MSLSFNDPAVLEHLVATTGLRAADPAIACQALAELAIEIGHKAMCWHGEVSRCLVINSLACVASKTEKIMVYAVEIDGQRFIPALAMLPVKLFHFVWGAELQAEAEQGARARTESTNSDFLGWTHDQPEKWRPPALLYCSNPIPWGTEPWDRFLRAAWQQAQAIGALKSSTPVARPDPLDGYRHYRVSVDHGTQELAKLLTPSAALMLNRQELAGKLAALAQDRQLPLQVVRRQVQVPHGECLWVGWQYFLRLGARSLALQKPGEWAGVEMHRWRRGHKPQLLPSESLAPVEPVRTDGRGLDEDAVEEQVLAITLKMAMEKETQRTGIAAVHIPRL